MENLILDVREPMEFMNEYIEGSINIPLSELICSASGIIKHYEGKKITLICRSGKRSAIAKDELLKIEPKLNIETFEGGISLWKAQGNPTVFKKLTFPIMRQVQIAAGFLVVLFSLLAVFINMFFIYLAIFIGCGLMFAGLTGFCGMALLLKKMPWNK